jgi:hypothetical protein
MTTSASSRRAQRHDKSDDSTKSNESAWTALPEDCVDFVLRLPVPAFEALSAMARYFDMSPEALARRYFSAGLRDDQARYFSEQALTTVEDTLRSRLGDERLVAELMSETRAKLRRGGNPRTRPGSPRAG